MLSSFRLRDPLKNISVLPFLILLSSFRLRDPLKNISVLPFLIPHT
jgi:hypothetical protein